MSSDAARGGSAEGMVRDMTGDNDTDKRHVWGPRPVGTLVPGLTRPAFRKRSPAGAQLMADWDSIVGPSMGATITPRRLIGGTLTLACSGPVAMELQHMSGPLLARINGHLGRIAVERLRFLQDPAPQQDPALQPGAAAPPEPDAPPPALPGVPAGPLHDALTSLGQAVERAERQR